ncbi:rolling circle replication-associated protein [Lysinibacillus sp. BSL11]
MKGAPFNALNKRIDIEDYEEMFTVDEDSVEDHLENLRDKRVVKCRRKTIKSGNILECEIYPIRSDMGKWERGKKKQDGRSSMAQKNLNMKNAIKHFVRLVNRNFTFKDIAMHLTYDNFNLPESYEQAKKDVTNYIRRIKRYMKKMGLGELKYIYVIEFADSEGKKVRVHAHIIMNFNDRTVAEELWAKGRANSQQLQPNESGLKEIARYMMKQQRKDSTKRYTPSRNLKQPIITIANNKVTRKRAERIALNQNTAHETFEKMYPGYQFNEIKVKYSPFTSGVYIYVEMIRIDNPVKTKRRLDI